VPHPPTAPRARARRLRRPARTPLASRRASAVPSFGARVGQRRAPAAGTEQAMRLVPACLLGCAAALAFVELYTSSRFADVERVLAAELGAPEASAAAVPPTAPEARREAVEPTLAETPPLPTADNRTHPLAAGPVLQQGRVTVSAEHRALTGCQSNPCGGLHCPSGWRTNPQCNSCVCERAGGDPCSGMTCSHGWSTQRSGSRCICVCPGGGCQGVPPRCRGVNSGCWINAECCSGRCNGIHRCRPGLR